MLKVGENNDGSFKILKLFSLGKYSICKLNILKSIKKQVSPERAERVDA